MLWVNKWGRQRRGGNSIRVLTSPGPEDTIHKRSSGWILPYLFLRISSFCLEDPRKSSGQRGHYKGGLFTGGISRIYRIPRFSKMSHSPLFSTVSGFSRISRVSKFSRKWTFLKRPLVQRHPFQEVLHPTPLNPTPATCHKRKQKLRCSFRNAEVSLQHSPFCSADVVFFTKC